MKTEIYILRENKNREIEIIKEAVQKMKDTFNDVEIKVNFRISQNPEGKIDYYADIETTKDYMLYFGIFLGRLGF